MAALRAAGSAGSAGISLATAAVHAGALKLGQTGIVKVTTLPTHPNYPGSTQNGITSSSWGSYPGFRVERLDDEDLDLADGEPPAAGTAAIAVASPVCDLPKSAPETEAPTSFSKPSARPEPMRVVWPAGLPAEAREQLDGYVNATAELRQATREKVARLAAEAVNRLKPIQDAHTRAARLDDAIAVRDYIRQLTP